MVFKNGVKDIQAADYNGKTIEKSYSNPTTMELFIERLGFIIDKQTIVITLFIPLRFSIFCVKKGSQPKLQMLSTIYYRYLTNRNM